MRGAGSGALVALQLCTPTNVKVGIFPIIDIFRVSYVGNYADSTDTILHFCFDLLLAEAACLSLRYSLCPVRKVQNLIEAATLTGRLTDTES